VSDHFNALQAECENVVKEERINDLRNIYPLLKPVPNGLQLLAEQFLNHVRTQGLQRISDLHGENVGVTFFSFWYKKLRSVGLLCPAMPFSLTNVIASINTGTLTIQWGPPV